MTAPNNPDAMDSRTLRSLIAEGWEENGPAWAQAVHAGAIASRVECTNAAILDEILASGAARVLDIGCGEGWLCRALESRGIVSFGIDASVNLVERARSQGGMFEILDYSALLEQGPPFTGCSWVCNFALIHEEDGPVLAQAARRYLGRSDTLIIQTMVQPAVALPEGATTGWQPGSWLGCGPCFGRTIPWFYRDQASWTALFQAHGAQSVQARVVCDPISRAPTSLIVVARDFV
jgi:SAM-dependent methyltransferase